jgi:hypothetical protein
MADIRAGKVQTVLVYKVDRLTRSLSDFARLIELFEARGISFVSVTQQFNTTTSMGRLMLNVLLSFAQFEREVTGSASATRSRRPSAREYGWVGPRRSVMRTNASEFSASYGCAHQSNLPTLSPGIGTWRKVRSRGPRRVRNRSHPPPPPRCISGKNVCEPSSFFLSLRVNRPFFTARCARS